MGRHYKDLVAWQKAMDLITHIYQVSSKFPARETYSLADQMRRAAVSVASNIAEGQAHYNRREFVHFLRHARGSLAELETQLLITQRLSYASSETIKPLLTSVEEVNRILSGLITSLRQPQTAAQFIRSFCPSPDSGHSVPGTRYSVLATRYYSYLSASAGAILAADHEG